ncbi:hypothetical protein [Cupriavidus sp. UYPR2.512]|uniref:hypothetical protein n=1 Tax=Cupriavidus sp. UYPR2.512 TaxID=1080187 RepID=UPI00037C0C41|nr:hypothetical protein [Cupriavidus sp. UYPR2.512]UIF90912.1 hypothetical protein KAF44_32520 [Cupriavidus necator]
MNEQVPQITPKMRDIAIRLCVQLFDVTPHPTAAEKLCRAIAAAMPAPAAALSQLSDEAVHYVLRQYFDGVTEEKAQNIAHDLRIGLGAAPAAPVAAPASEPKRILWPVTGKVLSSLANELVRAAESMGYDDELVLEVRAPGTFEDHNKKLNARHVLAVSLAEYLEEGFYPIDPTDPTGGRAAPASGEAGAMSDMEKGCVQTAIDCVLKSQPPGWPIVVNTLKAILAAPIAAGQEQAREMVGLKQAAEFIQKKADDYAREFGKDDMGSLSFGNEDMQIYHWHLLELADEIRALAAPLAESLQGDTAGASEPVAYANARHLAERMKSVPACRDADQYFTVPLYTAAPQCHVQKGWTASAEANNALLLLGRLDVSAEDDTRVEQIAAIVRGLVATPPATGADDARDA